MTNAPPVKVIYDTDPGVDDAMAMYYALAHPGIDVLGITTTFGNVSVEQAATNALYLTAIAGYTVPVTQGVETAGSQFFRRVVGALVDAGDAWDYRQYPHVDHIAETISTFQSLESVARRGE